MNIKNPFIDTIEILNTDQFNHQLPVLSLLAEFVRTPQQYRRGQDLRQA